MTYLPSDDSYLLVDAISEISGISSLEIGTGSGIITKHLCVNFNLVVSTDIRFNPEYTQDLQKYKNLFLLCCDSSCPLIGKFDLFVFNPPYLPNDFQLKDDTIHGGKNGVETTIKFLIDSKDLLKDNGRIVFIISSLSNHQILEEFIEKNSFNKRTLKEKRIFFETLQAIELTKKM